jgi:hypothetical protein
MSKEIEFVNGLVLKAPNDNAPEYVKAKGSIKVADMLEWLKNQPGEWVNFDVKVSQAGKWYAAVDNWKPNKGQERTPAKAEADPFDSVNF